MTNESRWGPSRIICAEYTSSMSVSWTLSEKSLRCLCRTSGDKFNETVSSLRTEAKWRHVVRGDVLRPGTPLFHHLSARLIDWAAPRDKFVVLLSSISGKKLIHTKTILLFWSLSASLLTSSHPCFFVLSSLLSLIHIISFCLIKQTFKWWGRQH